MLPRPAVFRGDRGVVPEPADRQPADSGANELSLLETDDRGAVLDVGVPVGLTDISSQPEKF
jgi:hypothetical protein